ncbi:MAG: DUF58 domain-containing protein [Endomicrobiia bacterium]
MIPKEVLRQIRRIQIKTNRLVNDIFAGQYGSIFKGRGMEFSEVREYQPGDEIKTIDWNVTARYGHPFVKKFIEERELTIMLLIDMSASEFFGTRNKIKSEIITEIASVIAFSAIKNFDKVGMIIFTDIIEKYIPPKKTLTHILRIIRETLYFSPKNKGTNIKLALEYLYHVQKKKSIVFLISDFIDSGYEHALKIVAKKHDLIAISITDRREKEISSVGFLEVFDSETGEMLTIDTRDKTLLEKYRNLYKAEFDRKREMFSKAKIDFIQIDTDKPYIEPLLKFFYMRARRFR